MEAAFGRRPTVVESIMVDGEQASIAKTYGNRYQILADLYILPISQYSPVVAPGAIQLATWEALYQGQGSRYTYNNSLQLARFSTY